MASALQSLAGDSVCSHNVQVSFCDGCVSSSRSTHVVGVLQMFVMSLFCAGTLCPLSHVPSPQRPSSYTILSCLLFVIDLQVRAKRNRIFFSAELVCKFVFILVLQFDMQLRCSPHICQVLGCAGRPQDSVLHGRRSGGGACQHVVVLV